jgi:hypothetical protein
MAYNFPQSPTIDDKFHTSDGKSFIWDGKVWQRIGNFSVVYTADNPPSNPVDNQLWYNSDTGNTYLFYADGDSRQWVQISPNGLTTTTVQFEYGDVKTGFQVGDHNGWVLLDGRVITALTLTQQNQAIALGFTANLPDTNLCSFRVDRNAAPGAVGGSAKVTLANLPVHNLTISGVTAASAGDHKHSIRWVDEYAVATDFYNFNPDNALHGIYFNHTGAGWHVQNAGATANPKGVVMNSGAHTHTLSGTLPLGGSATDYYAKALVVNMFVYLGL